MNKVVILGRVCKEIDLQFAKGTGKAVAKFSLAVPRAYKKDETDFINCIAFDKRAETIATYVQKGQRVLIEGHIQTGSYTNKEGHKVYTTDIIVDNFEFIERATGTKENNSNELSIDDLTPMDDIDSPF